MPSMPASKSFLFRLFLAVMASAPVSAFAADDPVAYRFGDWVLLSPVPLESGTQALKVPVDGLEFRFYWKDGSERAVALRFDGDRGEKDRSLLRSGREQIRFDGCKRAGAGGSIAKLSKKALPEAIPELPDDTALTMNSTERGLRRDGDTVVADLGKHRVQLTSDSPVVRAGEWQSADFCRYELNHASGSPEED